MLLHHAAAIIMCVGLVFESRAHDRRYSHPIPDRIRRPSRGRATSTADLRRTASLGRRENGPGETRTDAPGYRVVHEAYIRLVDTDKTPRWKSRGHFFAAAAEAMRRILVERARRKRSSKQGGDRKRVDLAEACSRNEKSPAELLAVNEALDSLAREDPIKAQLVKLRCFAGLSHQEAAEVLGISRELPTATGLTQRCISTARSTKLRKTTLPENSPHL